MSFKRPEQADSSSKKDCFYGIDDHDFTPEEKKELSEIRRY